MNTDELAGIGRTVIAHILYSEKYGASKINFVDGELDLDVEIAPHGPDGCVVRYYLWGAELGLCILWTKVPAPSGACAKNLTERIAGFLMGKFDPPYPSHVIYRGPHHTERGGEYEVYRLTPMQVEKIVKTYLQR